MPIKLHLSNFHDSASRFETPVSSSQSPSEDHHLSSCQRLNQGLSTKPKSIKSSSMAISSKRNHASQPPQPGQRSHDSALWGSELTQGGTAGTPSDIAAAADP
ncbi:hypothetical protein VTL71DRAFT_8338 [Oculimacula yallundae]|uniref:Uncharacterized protein n=1 Tax=Oculimacula yallundae TaxID=86028 RepID=A0ABR4CXB9_9HELO